MPLLPRLRPPRSLLVRFLLVALPVIGLVTAGTHGWLDRSLGDVLDASLTREIDARVALISASLESGMVLHDGTLLQKRFREMGESGDVRRLLLVDADGRIVESWPPGDAGRVPDRERDAPCRECHRPGAKAVRDRLDAASVRHAAVSLDNTGPCRACHSDSQRTLGMLLVEQDRGYRSAILRRLHAGLGTAAAVLFVLLGTALAVMFGAWVHRPVGRLIAATERVAAADLSVRIPEEGTGEIARLGRSFNRMTASLAESRASLVRTNRQLSAMYAILRDLSAAAYIDDLKVVVVRTLAGVLEAPHVALVMPAGDGLEIIEHAGGKTSRHLADAGVAGAHVPLPPEVLRRWDEPGTDGPRHDAPSGFVLVPLRAADRALGMLAVETPVAPSPDDLALLAGVARQVAVALENARLWTLAITDALTGLFSVRYFQAALQDRVAATRRNGRPLSLLAVDVDHFKRVNDTYGHPAGDAVLQGLAARVRALVRRADIAARCGGEEFSVLLPDTPACGAMVLAERLRERVAAEPFPSPAGSVTATISVGVVEWREPATAEELVAAADAALYRAKEQGRNRVCTS